MNIGLETNPLFVSKNRGIGNYALSLYNSLFELDNKNSYFLLNWQEESLIPLFPKFENAKEVFAKDINKDDNVNFFEITITHFIKKYSIDIFYNPNALNLKQPCLNKAWFGNAKLIGTVHDIIPWIMRSKYFTNEDSKNNYKKYCENLSEYDYLFSNSITTKEDVKRCFNISDIYNISMSVSDKEIKDEEADKIWDIFIAKKKIERPFFLYVGGLGVNKNVNRILRAYLHCSQKMQNVPQLVIVCKLNEQSRKQFCYFRKRYNLNNKLIFTDFVSDEELSAIYLKASWLIFPSMYEGFGMPVLEAWKHGLPVLTSNNSSLYEISEGAAVHVDPFSVESIEEGFRQISVMPEDKRKEFVILGMERVKDFSWKKTALKMIEFMEHITTKNQWKDVGRREVRE